MKLGRIHLLNFRTYKDAEVIFDEPLSLVFSDNASGKTSLVQGVQLGATGQCKGVDGKGVGARDKIMLGEDKAVITLGIETAKGPMEVVTTYSSGGRTQVIHPGSGGDEKTVKAMADGFSRFLDMQREPLSVVLDSYYLIRQKPADQKDILAALVLPTSYAWDEKPEDAKMQALVNKNFFRANPDGPQLDPLPFFNWGKPPVALIDEIYNAVYEGRKSAKITLGAIYIPPKPTQPEFNAEQVQEKLVALRAKHSKEAKAVKGGGTVQLGRIEQSITQEREKLAKAHADRKTAVDAQAAIDQEMLDGPALAKYKKVASGRMKYDQLNSQVEAVQSEIAAQKQAQEIFNELLQDDAGKPVDEAECPTCKQTITRKFIASKVAEHKKLEAAAMEEQTRLMKEQSALGDLAGAESAIKTHETKTAEKLEKVKAVTTAAERIVTIEKTIQDLEKTLTEAKAKEKAPPDTTALDALTAEIGEWEARLAPAVQYETTLRTIETSTKRWEEQNVKVSELETLCTFFGPKGIKARLIGENIGAFQDTMNEVLLRWGYTAKLSMEPYSFDVAIPKFAPKMLPIKELSGFEELAFCAAFQTAVAVFSKLRIVIVDGADVMAKSPQRQGVLLGTLKAMLDAGTLERAIVLATDLKRDHSQKPGVGYYFIEDGQVVRV